MELTFVYSPLVWTEDDTEETEEFDEVEVVAEFPPGETVRGIVPEVETEVDTIVDVDATVEDDDW